MKKKYTEDNIVGRKFSADGRTYKVTRVEGDKVWMNFGSDIFKTNAEDFNHNLQFALDRFNEGHWRIIETVDVLLKPTINDDYNIF